MMDPNKGFNRFPNKLPRASRNTESVECILKGMGRNIKPNDNYWIRGVGSSNGDSGGGSGGGSNLLFHFSIMSLASTILILLEYLDIATVANIQNQLENVTSTLASLAATVPTFNSIPTWLINCTILLGMLPGLFVSLILASALLTQLSSCCCSSSSSSSNRATKHLNAFSPLTTEARSGCWLVQGWLVNNEKPQPPPPIMPTHIPLLAWNATMSIRMAHLISMAREAKDLKMWLASIRKRRPCYGWSVAGGRELREGVAKFVCAAMMLDTVHAMPVTWTGSGETTRGQGWGQSLWVVDVVIMTLTAAVAVFGVPQAIKTLLERAWAWLSAVIDHRLEPLDEDDEGGPMEDEDHGETDTVAAFAGNSEPPRASTEMVAFDYAIVEQQGSMSLLPQTGRLNAVGSWVDTLPRDRLVELDDDDLVDNVLGF